MQICELRLIKLWIGCIKSFYGLWILLENSFGIIVMMVNKRINSDPKSWRFLSRLSALGGVKKVNSPVMSPLAR